MAAAVGLVGCGGGGAAPSGSSAPTTIRGDLAHLETASAAGDTVAARRWLTALQADTRAARAKNTLTQAGATRILNAAAAVAADLAPSSAPAVPSTSPPAVTSPAVTPAPPDHGPPGGPPGHDKPDKHKTPPGHDHGGD